uniref:Uncharacterized protein n=1 Tax=Quercus lobata TaxID=97700 RepID=A0A7N2M484_QUELO
MVSAYAVWVMMTYLTNVWRLDLTHAAAIVNVFTGAATIMPIGMAFLVDAFMGDYWMLLLSSLAYSFVGDELLGNVYTTCPFLMSQATVVPTIQIALLNQTDARKKLWNCVGNFAVILLALIGSIALPYIKPWSVRFGIPAICTVLSTFLFICGSCKSCSCEPGSKNKVKDTKIFIRMVPMWMTFIICGVVISMGNTYFLEQAKNMNHKVGKLKVPLPIFKIFYDLVKDLFTKLYIEAKKIIPPNYLAPCGIIVAMLLSILCCITATKMETRRLDVIRRHCLHDKPIGKIPMSIFLLLPQYLLLGALDGISNFSIDYFLTDQFPASMKHYSRFFTNGAIGTGTMGSVLSVYVVGKVSESGGKPSRFQDTLNKSRLDNYYWTLTVLSSINLVLYILVALWYNKCEQSVHS